MDEKIKLKIKDLTDKLNYYSRQYYTFDNSEISDYEYDILYKELVKLEEETGYSLIYSPTKRVGDVVVDDFDKVEHLVKMDSLQDAFSFDEIYKFYSDVLKKVGTEVDFVLEKKIDGLSVCLTYENGIFTKGATRGDGFIGEDVTENLKTIKTLPLTVDTDIPFFQVRGEVFLSKENFKNLIEKQKKENEESFKNLIEKQKFINQKKIDKIKNKRENKSKTNEELDQLIKEQNIKNEKIINELLIKKEKIINNVFKNPRNAAAGSLRQKSSKIVSQRNLDIFIFNLQHCEYINFNRHSESLDWLKKIGFLVSEDYYVSKNIEDILKNIEDIGLSRYNYSYEIDGAVLKVDDLKFRNILGSTDKTPKWAIAFKYPPEEKTSKILSIDVNVGRTGVLTPVAIFSPINISGTTVSKAVLHNQDFINEKNIKIGDVVSIRKAGEIIPEVVRVIEHSKFGEAYKIPSFCPSCNKKTVRLEDESAIKCINKDCPEQIYKKIVYFASRPCMDIEGLGESIVRKLFDKKLVTKIEDIYNIDYNINVTKDSKTEILFYNKNYNDFVELDNFKEKSASNLMNAINKSKTKPFETVLFSLGIDNIGKKSSLLLVQKFKNIDNIINASVNDILEIEGFGKTMAKSVINFFEDEKVLSMISFFKENKFCLEYRNVYTTNLLDEKTFVVTGVLKNYKRKEVEEIILNLGGQISNSISKKVDYLVCGDSPGSKYEKAKDLNINIINEEDFIKMIKENN